MASCYNPSFTQNTFDLILSKTSSGHTDWVWTSQSSICPRQLNEGGSDGHIIGFRLYATSM